MSMEGAAWAAYVPLRRVWRNLVGQVKSKFPRTGQIADNCPTMDHPRNLSRRSQPVPLGGRAVGWHIQKLAAREGSLLEHGS